MTTKAELIAELEAALSNPALMSAGAVKNKIRSVIGEAKGPQKSEAKPASKPAARPEPAPEPTNQMAPSLGKAGTGTQPAGDINKW